MYSKQQSRIYDYDRDNYALLNSAKSTQTQQENPFFHFINELKCSFILLPPT